LRLPNKLLNTELFLKSRSLREPPKLCSLSDPLSDGLRPAPSTTVIVGGVVGDVAMGGATYGGKEFGLPVKVFIWCCPLIWIKEWVQFSDQTNASIYNCMIANCFKRITQNRKEFSIKVCVISLTHLPRIDRYISIS
jgi:hypothetical protein